MLVIWFMHYSNTQLQGHIYSIAKSIAFPKFLLISRGLIFSNSCTFNCYFTTNYWFIWIHIEVVYSLCFLLSITQGIFANSVFSSFSHSSMTQGEIRTHSSGPRHLGHIQPKLHTFIQSINESAFVDPSCQDDHYINIY